ncbi:hypothetical protein [Micromonospora inaquosa]|uniref:hypothetical protein n=1 Tax=Micromonospora inaquosa TaxID=2203716 RepID=UPI001ABF3899|nr:hypothetical protein [Micromonospora inaquosa]
MPRISPTIRARWCDSGDIAKLVADSLHTSAVAGWLVPDEDRRRSMLNAVSRIWIEHALLFGEAFLLGDRSAAAVCHPSRPSGVARRTDALIAAVIQPVSVGPGSMALGVRTPSGAQDQEALPATTGLRLWPGAARDSVALGDE